MWLKSPESFQIRDLVSLRAGFGNQCSSTMAPQTCPSDCNAFHVHCLSSMAFSPGTSLCHLFPFHLLEPYLVTPRPSHIPHPLNTTIVPLLKHLQISHQQPTTREHQQTKTHTQRRPTPRLLRRHARQLRLRTTHELIPTHKSRDLPYYAITLWLILCFSLRGALCNVRGVERCRDTDNDISSEEFAAVIGPYGDGVLDFRGADFSHDGVDFEGEIDVLGAAVAHQLELAVRRHEADGAVAVEFRELYALVELAVLERYTPSRCSCCFTCAGDVAYWSGVGA